MFILSFLPVALLLWCKEGIALPHKLDKKGEEVTSDALV